MKKQNSKSHVRKLAVCALLVSSAATSVMSFSIFAMENLHRVVENGAREYLITQLTENSQDTNIDVAIVKIDDRINIPECSTG